MDVLTPKQRTKNMKSIKSKDTSIEVKLRKALWHNGVRYRKNFDKLPGKPDIAITKYKIAVFCDSEFFHGKDWEKSLKKRLQKSDNGTYWITKIEQNIERDKKVNRELALMGWQVIRFWGEEIGRNTEQCVKTVSEAIFISLMEDKHAGVEE